MTNITPDEAEILLDRENDQLMSMLEELTLLLARQKLLAVNEVLRLRKEIEEALERSRTRSRNG